MNAFEILGLLCAGGLVVYGLLYCLIGAAEVSTTSYLRRRRDTTTAREVGREDAVEPGGPTRTAFPPAIEQRLAACALASVANEILATSQRMQVQIEALRASRMTGEQIDPEASTSTAEDVVRHSMLVPDHATASTAGTKTLRFAADDLPAHAARLNDALHVLRALDDVLRLKCRQLQGAEQIAARPSEAP